MATLRKFLILPSLLAGFLCNSAAAAYLDFTDNLTIGSLSQSGNVFSGVVDGVAFTLTSDLGSVKFNESYDGSLNTGCQSGGGPLKCDRDGAGINNDEVTGLSPGPGQTLILEFATEVLISSFDFLDLYLNPDGRRGEQATVDIDGNIETIGAGQTSGQGGYANLDLLALGGPVLGKTIRFSANPDSDFWDDHDNDYAFAGVEVSAVPVPAAVWLFGTALIGLLGFSKPKKSS